MQATLSQERSRLEPSTTTLRSIPHFMLEPVRLVRSYDRANFRPDLVAGLTVAVILLPQAIAFTLIAELPPEMGFYAAIMGGIFGALWGSSDQMNTGPANAIALLIFSVLLTTAEPGSERWVVAAGIMAVMAGIFQLVMGLARLGVLVNFVSHSVIVGFTSGAGMLIVIKQLKPLMGAEFTSHNIAENLVGVATHISDIHQATIALGAGVMILIVALRRINQKLPGPLIGMIVASVVVYGLKLDQAGVDVIGELPKNLPPLAHLPFDWGLIAELSTGALAVGAIGLVESVAIARSFSAQTGQRLDSNQEFIGQGLANIASGLFSGYAVAGSFSRSAVNFKAGAKSRVAPLITTVFVILALFVLAPLAVYLPRTALAGVLIVIGIGMIDRAEIRRIWQGAPDDALIMLVTFFGTLFLAIEFAVLLGIVLSLVLYILATSVPKVYSVVPDSNYTHFLRQETRPACPQLGILDIMGDLYFGAVNHIEEAIYEHQADNPGQRYLLLRFDNVINCDFSGIHMLESVVRSYRDQGGDVYMVRVHETVLDLMKSTGFYEYLGAGNFLAEDQALAQLFYKQLDPAVCIYECDARVFKECQNLPKRTLPRELWPATISLTERSPAIPARQLWDEVHSANPPLVVDVREPREYRRGHVPDAQLLPLPRLIKDEPSLPKDRPIVLTCRSGRRSMRAAALMRSQGYENVSILDGGLLAWEAANLLEAVDL